jgi:hypothetical protein
MNELKTVPDKLVVEDKYVVDYPIDESKTEPDKPVVEDKYVVDYPIDESKTEPDKLYGSTNKAVGASKRKVFNRYQSTINISSEYLWIRETKQTS